VFTYEPTLALSAARSRIDDEFEGIPVRRAAFARDAEGNGVLATWRSALMAEEFRRWIGEWKPERLQVFHLMGVGAGVLEEARAAGIPALVHATDFFVVCPAATLTLPNGDPCEGPPEHGLGCFGCVHRDVGELLRSESLHSAAAAIAAPPAPPRIARPLLGALVAGLVGRREELVSQVNRARAIAAPSKFLLETLAGHGVRRDRLVHVPYGIDLERLAGLGDANNTRDAKNTRDATITFGYFGTIAPHKGVLPLVRAFRDVKNPARLLLRGKIGEFPEYGAEVERAAKGDPRIHLAGPFAPSELGAALSEIDVLVVPSLWHENAPFVALEALAAKRPVIASDRGGLAEIVGPGRGGALVPAGDEAALARAISQFCDRAAIERARAEIAPARGVAQAFEDLRRLME
jgi:hypothetical protein